MSDAAKLFVELENGRFTGVSSDTPRAFDNITVAVMDRQVAPGDMTDDPLADVEMSQSTVKSVDGDDETLASVGVLTVQDASWAIGAVLDGMGDDEAAPGGEEEANDDAGDGESSTDDDMEDAA